MILQFPLIGTWKPGQVEVSWTDSSRPHISEIEQIIEQTWLREMMHPGVQLFDGSMCRLESFEARPADATLHLSLSRTSYKPFVGTNLHNAQLAEKYGRAALANGVGLSAALVSGDGFLLLGRRNGNVAYYPNRLHPFSGSLEPADRIDVFDDVRRELREELSLQPSDIAQIVCTGIAEDQALLQPELMFAVRSNKTMSQIESQIDLSEHRGIWSIPATQHALDQALEELNEAFTPIGIAAMLFWGRVEFGEHWFDERCRGLP
jgi:hypothetical protein